MIQASVGVLCLATSSTVKVRDILAANALLLEEKILSRK